ncbi:MAG: (Fe-S)-binding protein [bacterium]|nr:(Fe-S)-binding protein [bacterium]MDE0288417.1 (Fe-S)-binding protein [bacterium]MDE0438359.1 (Fe-S)-binding protein [bacterium]
MGWVTDHAPHPDDLASCVQCGLCLPSCPTFRLTGLETASPRGRLTAMAAVAAGRPVDNRFAEIMGSCLQCRACEVVCPGFVPFGKAMEGARAEVAAQLPGLGRRIRWLVTVRMLRSRAVIRVATSLISLAQVLRLKKLTPRPFRGALTGVRPLAGRPDSVLATNWPAVGESRGVAALLAGCVMDQWFGDVHAATIGLLTRSGYEVIVPPAQTCCGALAAHDGWADAAREMAAANIAALEDADVVVVNAAGCSAHMKEYGHWAKDGARLAGKVMDVTEVVAAAIEEGRLPRLGETGQTVAVQDPCHLRHVQRVTGQPRAILAAAGFTALEIDPDGRCCGAAGIYSVLEPELSSQLGKAKAEQIRATRSKTVSSANPGCEIQLRSHLAESGMTARVAHPVELYWERLQERDPQPAGR